MTLYDRITHALGLAASGLLGAQATGLAPAGYIPVWLLIVAWVIATVAQTTTAKMVGRDAARVVLPLLFAVALVSGCPHNGPGPSPVKVFGHCVSDALTRAGQSVLGHVMTALAQGDYVAELAALGAQFGGDVVGCAVDLAIDELRGQFFASRDPGVQTLLERAQAWRGANP